MATAGTDTHSVRAYAANPGFSVVYAEALSEAALLKALRAGHLYLSVGPQITFEAQNESGETWIMGDAIAQPVTFVAAWNDCPADARVRLIANGRLLDHWIAGAHGEREWNLAPYQAHWVVVEIRDGSGGLLAITNPIYLG